MITFAVTYTIVTPESAEDGDVDESGFIGEDLSLRDAIEYLFETRTSGCGGVESIECNEYPITCPRWITVTNGVEFETGAQESRSLHFPKNISAASRIRLVKLLNIA
jgi:hypothetical protein